MNNININKAFILSLFFPIIAGCASHTPKPRMQKYCRVVHVQWIENVAATPDKGTRTGVVAGAGTGAVIGSVVGGAAGVLTGAALAVGTFGIGAAAIPALAASGAAAGAGIGAGSGALGGGAIGYIHDHKQKSGAKVYQYKVECGKQEFYTVRRMQKIPFQLQEPVYIYWEKENLMVRPVQQAR